MSADYFPYSARSAPSPNAPRSLKTHQSTFNRARRHLGDLRHFCSRHLAVTSQTIHDYLLYVGILRNYMIDTITDITDNRNTFIRSISPSSWKTNSQCTSLRSSAFATQYKTFETYRRQTLITSIFAHSIGLIIFSMKSRSG